MLPIIVLSSAWAEALGWSHSEIGQLLLNLDPASAGPAGEGDLCPQCKRHPTDSEGWLFVPESATATPEQVRGRMVVKCLCKTTYWCTGIYETGDVHQPIGRARVRVASESVPVAPSQPPLPEPLPPGRGMIATPQRIQQNLVPQQWFFPGVPLVLIPSSGSLHIQGSDATLNT